MEDFVKDYEEDVLIGKAMNLMYVAHAEGVDKGGKPYFLHPLHIFQEAVKLTKDKRVWIVALLHDVIEDNELYSFSDIKSYGDDVLEAVKAITKSKEESYQAYVERVKGNSIARFVKILDLRHNSDLSRLGLNEVEILNKKVIERQKKYLDALTFLGELQ